MEITPLFTAEDFLRAARGLDNLPENAPQARSKPRASAIGACARQNAYMMLNTPVTNEGSDDSVLTAEQGRMFEDISVEVVRNLGYEVVDRQLALPDDYPLSGHPDGRLVPIEGDIEAWEKRNGRWGFEHKHLGRWAYETVWKKGLQRAEPAYVAQTTMYADALGWDKVLYVIVAQDASSTRGDATANLRAKRPSMRWATINGWNPKVQVVALDCAALKHGLGKRLKQRAEWLSKVEAAAEVKREYNPEQLSHANYGTENGQVVKTMGPEFPCSYCEWYDRCIKDGSGGREAPALPFSMGGEQ